MHGQRQKGVLRKIQVVLGHSSIKSTQVYTQVAPSQIAAIKYS